MPVTKEIQLYSCLINVCFQNLVKNIVPWSVNRSCLHAQHGKFDEYAFLFATTTSFVQWFEWSWSSLIFYSEFPKKGLGILHHIVGAQTMHHSNNFVLSEQNALQHIGRDGAKPFGNALSSSTKLLKLSCSCFLIRNSIPKQ